jgi:hypothetical protein
METLSRLKALLQQGEIGPFEQHLAIIARERKTDDLAQLFLLFDDTIDEDVMMYSIIHTVEILDHETYISLYLNAAESVFRNAPGWASQLLIRIVNHPSALNILKRMLSADPDKIDIISRVRQRALEIKSDMPLLP